MSVPYLYIDDENDSTTQAIAEGLEIETIIKVSLSEPQQFKEQKAWMIENQNNFQGILLDLRLDGKRLDIPYNAPALAQELRMMTAEGLLRSMPIVLCSTLEKMRATYEIDKTSHDLFDYKFHKQERPPWKKFATKMASLATGYTNIVSLKFELDAIFNRDLTVFDTGIFEKFSSLEQPLPTFEYAAFVIKEFFHHPGLLLKETLVAARLGIDIVNSGDRWIELREKHLSDIKYSGVFSDGWNRWWADLLAQRFKDLTGKRLSVLNADERVALLSEKTGITDLVPATPITRNSSNKFWTICEYYKKPLDPLEGFKIHTSIEPKSWQESKYISLDAVLNGREPKPHSSELSRIELIKESLS